MEKTFTAPAAVAAFARLNGAWKDRLGGVDYISEYGEICFSDPYGNQLRYAMDIPRKNPTSYSRPVDDEGVWAREMNEMAADLEQCGELYKNICEAIAINRREGDPYYY